MLRRFRIVVQLACLALFLYLLGRTVGIGQDRLGPPVRIFLDIDPLIALTTWLRTRALPGLMALSLITLAATFVLGRFFCGWVCPLGTLSQVSGRLHRGRQDERTADRWRPSQRWKYLILVFLLGGAAAGTLWTGILDPISLLIRSLAVGFAPPIEALVRAAASIAASGPLAPVSEPVYGALRNTFFAPRAPHFEQGALLAGILLALLALSWIRRRFWCRVLCPLGGLLGAVAQAGSLTLRQKESVCTGCAVCTFHCQGAADPNMTDGWRPSECFVCGNCTASCRQKGVGLSFGFTVPRLARRWRRRRGAPAAGAQGTRANAPLDPGRRRLLLAFGLGVVSGPIGRISPSRAVPPDSMIRPPGAGTEDEFLDRCVRCGECMRVCPGNGLHPDGLKGGPAGLWAPVLRARLGYCEYHCTLCGQVCPTGAIRRLLPGEKEKTVIGLAYVDPGRCLPYAFATPCIVCEEHCPTSPKAIVLEDVRVRALDGATRDLRQPRIDPRLCVGCGICEYRCPVDGAAAIRVVGTGRTGRGSPFDLG
jgi:polyferredoxin